jgi:hypothetical protein
MQSSGVAALLVKFGANPALRDADGSTPYEKALIWAEIVHEELERLSEKKKRCVIRLFACVVL